MMHDATTHCHPVAFNLDPDAVTTVDILPPRIHHFVLRYRLADTFNLKSFKHDVGALNRNAFGRVEHDLGLFIAPWFHCQWLI